METTNMLGLKKSDYRGQESTLCVGCGHVSIIHQLISACFELDIPPERIVKLSGIGCSSKAPAYMIDRAHGFNGLHGRMSSMATGAVLANPTLQAIGLSGDGDTANIGLGQFKHLVRRNVPMVYIVANNGVYGLTKGQYSATADYGLTVRGADENCLPPVDICVEALAGGASFVARAFAGDPKQLLTLLKAALSHNGISVVDVISPCVTFNNKDESPKSYAYGKRHEEQLQDLTFIPPRADIRVEYLPGELQTVVLHDGSKLFLRKLALEYDPTNREQAVHILEHARSEGRFITGLIYVDETQINFVQRTGLEGAVPLAQLTEKELRPPSAVLRGVCQRYA
jgi:2-oxoglutarate/2-oxoacid ferredoxin oxidoreductase subunit beta